MGKPSVNINKYIRHFEKLKTGIDPNKEPGFCAAIVHRGETVYTLNHGLASIEHQSPLTGNSLFYLASESKQFTAASILNLVHENKLQLKQDVRGLVTEVAHYNRKISVQNLLNHTSGIPDYFQYIDASIDISGGHDNDYFDNSHIMKAIDNSEPVFRPNTRHQYSNSNYIVLAELAKVVSGQSLPKYAKKHIFRPVGMKQTLYDDDRNRVIKHRVCSYTHSKNKYRIYLKNSCTVGDGGVLSSINDLVKWEINLLDNKHLPARVVTGLTRPSRLTNGEELTYANGLEVSSKSQKTSYSFHGGGFGGFTTFLFRVPSLELSFIYLSNNERMNHKLYWYHRQF